ncbi:MAG TPA: vitamin K epoxide reductase family protein [Spirochaetota bacterium]|nr:vitamin K epoxide reductase family protein [Spirochaetota bacterium]
MKRYAVIVMLLSLAGLLLSLLLLIEQFNDPALINQTVCGNGWQSTCLEVTASKYSNIAGVPLAALGGVFFVWIFLVTLLGMLADREWQQRTARIMMMVTLFALLVDVFLAGVMASMGAVCELCVATYVVNAALLVIFFLWLRAEGTAYTGILKKFLRDVGDILTRRYLRFAGGMLILFSVSILLLGSVTSLLLVEYYGDEVPPHRVIESYMKQYKETPREKLDLPQSSLVIGNPGAKVEVVVFTDFLCSACYQFFRVERYLLSLFGDQVVFRYYHYPLDKECNPDVKVTMYQGSCRVSATLQAAAAAGKFKDVLLAHYTSHHKMEEMYGSLAGYDEIYRAMGISREMAQKLESDAERGGTKRRIRRDAMTAAGLSINSTPTLFINGSRMVGVPPKEFLKAVVEYELQR